MFEAEIETLIETCYKKIITSNRPAIKKAIRDSKKVVNEDFYELFMENIIKKFVSIVLISELPVELHQDMFLDLLKEEQKIFKDAFKTYQFHISLNGLNDKLYRIIEIPAVTQLSDLAYMILTLFKANASHLFNFKIKQTRYISDMEFDSGDYFDENEKTSNIPLTELNLRKNSKFTFTYDYGDHYEFTIQLINITEQNPDQISHMNIIEGQGYGIWEDGHYEMNLYYSDKKAYNLHMKENGIDPNYYPTRAKFNLEKTRQSFDSEFMNIKITYEDDFFDDEFDEDDDWDLLEDEFDEDDNNDKREDILFS